MEMILEGERRKARDMKER